MCYIKRCCVTLEWRFCCIKPNIPLFAFSIKSRNQPKNVDFNGEILKKAEKRECLSRNFEKRVSRIAVVGPTVAPEIQRTTFPNLKLWSEIVAHCY